MRTIFHLLIAASLFGLTSIPPVSAQSAAPTEPNAQVASQVWPSAPLASGKSRFEFNDWAGPALPVFAYVPPSVDRSSASILIVMHGLNRDPERYLGEWIDKADAGGFIVIAPEFAKSDFATSRQYNLGNVVDKGATEWNDEGRWSFSAIEPLFDMVVARLGSNQSQYTLYGHSAGSQFVHRFLFLKPNARVKRYLAANAGWYTFPDPETAFPFGLKRTPVGLEALKTALAKDVVILLGDQDSDPDHSSLNRSDGAMRQGKQRFARGQAFYKAAKELAHAKGWEFGWSVRVVEGVAHANNGMAEGSFDLVE